MPRGRKPLATKTKELNGAFAKNPQRRNVFEPQPQAGAPEKTPLVAEDPEMSRNWDLFCKELDAMGLLTKTDAWLLEEACITYANVMEAYRIRKRDGLVVVGTKGNLISNPASLDFHKSSDRWLKLLGELGLTPSARTRMQAAPKEDVDPFSEFLKETTN